jgi:3-phosphoshikimate 1-carboxyvinyltransferase
MVALSKLRVAGSLRVPGDKSISHRALILSAVTRGKSRVQHVLNSADIRCTAQALRALGADVPPLSDDFYVTGKASRFLVSPLDVLDCGNSGTTARLMAGVVAGAGLAATLVGDESLTRRPMRRVADPLRAMGADIQLAPHGGLPMAVKAGPLRPVDWTSSVASAQVKSAVLLAALLAGVRASVREPHRSRDHTERMLGARGIELEREGTAVVIGPGQIPRPADTRIPADPSSAAFFVALGALAARGEIRLQDVCLNDTRTGFLTVLRRMGAQIHVEGSREADGEPVGDIVARPSELHGIDIAPDEVPSLIDELPLFACVAAMADGVSEVRGATELRVKESDRIATIVANLRALGVEVEELSDGFRVVGAKRRLRGIAATAGDHRIAMSFGVLAALPGNEIVVDDRDCVDISYPGFWQDLANVTQ